MLKYIRALPLVIVAGAVVYFSIIICLDNGDWTYIFARVSGMDAEHANNLAYIAIAIQSLFFHLRLVLQTNPYFSQSSIGKRQGSQSANLSGI